jgi:hypothetical protein
MDKRDLGNQKHTCEVLRDPSVCHSICGREALNVLNGVRVCGECIELVDICLGCGIVVRKAELVEGKCAGCDAKGTETTTEGAIHEAL